MISSSIQLNLRIPEAIQRVVQAANAGLRDMAETTMEPAKDNSPVLTGHNKSTITWDEENGVFRVYTQSGYGGYLETGTAKMPAQPYIFPAYNQAKQELSNNIQSNNP